MTMTKTRLTGAVAVMMAGLALTGCRPGLETRTFPVEHLEPYEVAPLIEPYVYGDREGAPGTAATTNNAVTVRETPENLDRIEAVLARYDQPRPDYQLHFQLIEAGGFEGSDPAIAAVEEELRGIFSFRGYRLAGAGTVFVTGESDFLQGLRSSEGRHEVHGTVSRNGAEGVRLADVSLISADGWSLRTSVNVRDGQTLVLGSQPVADTELTLFLTVRAEAVNGPGTE